MPFVTSTVKPKSVGGAASAISWIGGFPVASMSMLDVSIDFKVGMYPVLLKVMFSAVSCGSPGRSKKAVLVGLHARNLVVLVHADVDALDGRAAASWAEAAGSVTCQWSIDVSALAPPDPLPPVPEPPPEPAVGRAPREPLALSSLHPRPARKYTYPCALMSSLAFLRVLVAGAGERHALAVDGGD